MVCRCSSAIAGIACSWCALCTVAAASPTIWTGPTRTFTKSAATPQDSLTASVALTRGSTQGMFNIAQESSFSGSSPADTEWATAVNNPSATIAATDWAALSFTDWTHAYGGPGSTLQTNITSKNAVVHLITDNIYLNLQFTQFSIGGAFSYQRSTPVPEPSTMMLAAAALWMAGIRLRPGSTRD